MKTFTVDEMKALVKNPRSSSCRGKALRDNDSLRQFCRQEAEASNGLFYHCVQNKPAGYHLMKTKLCSEKGYRLLHVWEDDWTDRNEETREKIARALDGSDLKGFTDDCITLDRSWYEHAAIDGYSLVGETAPSILRKSGFDVEDCGCLVFKKEVLV